MDSRIEARFGKRQAQKLECLVGMLDERLQGAADGIVAGVEGQFYRARGKPLLEGVRIMRPCALVEEPRQHLRDARLVGRVLRRAALEGEGDGNERHDVRSDVPCVHAARRDDDRGLGGRHLRLLRGQGFGGSRHGVLVLRFTRTFSGSRSPSGAG